MDFFNHPYYVTMKNINCVLGVWPYQDRWKNIVCRIISIILLTIQLTGQMICFIVNIHDKKIVMELMMIFLSALYCVVKYLNNIIHLKTMTKLLESIKENQAVFMRGKEKEILDNHARSGQLFVHGYSFIAYATILLFLCEPSMQYFKSVISPSNQTILHKYPVSIHWYFVDMEKNFYPIWGFESICILAILTAGLSNESTFFTFSQHARGLFVIVQHQFKNLPTRKGLEIEGNIKTNFRKIEDIQYNYYRMCIKNHKRAFKFASLLEIMYVWCFGLVIVLCVPAISYTIIQLLTQSNTTQEVIQLIMFVMMQLLDLFITCYLSQQLIDESENVQKYINFSKWYKVPINTQKLLILATLRSQKPSGITAGKIMTLGMETYGMMVKTVMSYSTVLMAVQ